MVRGYFRGFTTAEKTELWDRWQRGESLKAIGRAFGKPSSSIYFQLAPHGGIRPAPRRRSRLALTLSEREEISRGIALYQSARSIARLLGRSPSTVSREINRNGGHDRYRAALADDKGWDRTRRAKRCKLANNSRLRRVVARKLRLNWSPEQIAGWLKRTYPEDKSFQVSHETIYRSLFVQARGVLKKAAAPSAIEADDPSIKASRAAQGSTRANRGSRFDKATAGSGRRSRGSRSLGRRSAVRVEKQLCRDPGRTAYALRDVGEGRQQGHTGDCHCSHQAGQDAADGALVANLGPRKGACRPPTVHVSNQHQCVLLRPAKSVAAGFQ